MTEEQIKQTSKITEFARNMVKQSNYPKELQDHIIATCTVVVTEATRELQEKLTEKDRQIEELYFNHCGHCNRNKLNSALQEQMKNMKKCLKDIVYMAGSGLYTKNELAFARLITEAKVLLSKETK